MSTTQVVDSIKVRQDADTISANADEDERPDVTDLLTKGLDPQLQTALLLLQAHALGEVQPGERHARK